jgi:ribosomal protein S12 methylthiotransferase accessory factor
MLDKGAALPHRDRIGDRALDPIGLPGDLFERAAAWLAAENPSADCEAQTLLAALGYARDSGISEEAELERERRSRRIALLRVAARSRRIFRLRSPTAPGLICLGAQFSPGLAGELHKEAPEISVSGVGLTMQTAFQACVGEAVEYLSQLETGEEGLERVREAEPRLAKLAEGSRAFLAEMMHAGRAPAAAELDWCRTRRLSDRSEVFLPAEICLRRPKGRELISPPFLLGTGTAAGENFEAAALHGLLELIERDAAALWWRGGRRGRIVALDEEGLGDASRLVAHLRGGIGTRRSWVLDITTEVGVPCAAALSCRADGFGLAFGLAARPRMRDAMHAAILEMCQIELADAVVDGKLRDRGVGGLNERDLAHLRRATSIDAEHCTLLHPLAPRREAPAAARLAPASLGAIVARLAELGIEVFAVDLQRRAFAVPAARVIAPGLQLEPSELATPRLHAAILETGGGATYTRGAKLL